MDAGATQQQEGGTEEDAVSRSVNELKTVLIDHLLFTL